MKRVNTAIVAIGLFFLIISQLFLSFGYDFLMAQQPIDFTHWLMLFSALFSIGLWFVLPNNVTKRIGLVIMTAGVAGIIGMCCIDFILWAANDNPELKDQIFKLISEYKSIKLPFLIIGPTLFYMGMGVATYGLFRKHTWQVVILNLGLLMIGLGHLILNNRNIPVIGSILLFFGMISILMNNDSAKYSAV